MNKTSHNAFLFNSKKADNKISTQLIKLEEVINYLRKNLGHGKSFEVISVA